MITRSQAKLAATAADALVKQPFRFLDLPKELRLMVYDELMDNSKNSRKYTTPSKLDILDVRLDGLYYPSLLRVSKLVRDKYWPLCLHDSILWVEYACAEPDQPNEENDEEGKPTMPPLSEWLVMPIGILERITEVVFKFQAYWMLPDFNPFSGIADCINAMPDLKFLAIWSEMDMAVVERGGDQTERERRSQNFVEFLFDEEGDLLVRAEDEGRELLSRVDCNLWTPLYEMNKNYRWPRRRHLEQGVAALAGLPEWGYSMFKVAAPWDRPLEGYFTYYGEEMTFLRIERKLPVAERMETECDSPSEFDYEFDESGWATGNEPDWS